MNEYNFACGSVLVRNSASGIKRGSQTEALENRVLRRIFETNRDEVPGEWRGGLNNAGFHNFLSSRSKITIIQSTKT
jgi:hypothetical protein